MPRNASKHMRKSNRLQHTQVQQHPPTPALQRMGMTYNQLSPNTPSKDRDETAHASTPTAIPLLLYGDSCSTPGPTPTLPIGFAAKRERILEDKVLPQLKPNLYNIMLLLSNAQKHKPPENVITCMPLDGCTCVGILRLDEQPTTQTKAEPFKPNVILLPISQMILYTILWRLVLACGGIMILFFTSRLTRPFLLVCSLLARFCSVCE